MIPDLFRLALIVALVVLIVVCGRALTSLGHHRCRWCGHLTPTVQTRASHERQCLANPRRYAELEEES